MHHDNHNYIPEFTQEFIPFITVTDPDENHLNIPEYLNNTEFPIKIKQNFLIFFFS